MITGIRALFVIVSCHRVAGFLSALTSNQHVNSKQALEFPSQLGMGSTISKEVSAADNNDDDDSHTLLSLMNTNQLSQSLQQEITQRLQEAHLVDEGEYGSLSLAPLVLLARDFRDRPELVTSFLIRDFGFPPLIAHQTRALVMEVIDRNDPLTMAADDTTKSEEEAITKEVAVAVAVAVKEPKEEQNANAKQEEEKDQEGDEEEETKQKQKKRHGNFKAVVVNSRAQSRRQKSSDGYEYGLPKDYHETYPTLAKELDNFYTFMTQPSTQSQEDPIRPATADVYLRHAKLFLGWHVRQSNSPTDGSDDNMVTTSSTVSLFEIVPNMDKESAGEIIDYILWLRSRQVSVSYEANVLRGLLKLLKFRFASESTSEAATYGGTTFTDVPVIKELRKLHRDANKRQKTSSRSSNEQKKWLSWPEFLSVIASAKQETQQLAKDFRNTPGEKLQIKVAESFQRYLILAILATIPDRQRTIRELELGKTLIKLESNDDDTNESSSNEGGSWVVKHGPDDYKTGKAYGDRPAMPLGKELSDDIDNFIDHWRPSLQPKTEYLFVQSRTGKPLTRDSVFQRVSRCCFKFTGKKTNPHLLRDMIVTHVRKSNASEKELEALALLMGHSLQMQRSSYDRRTLTDKIAPAVRLMEAVNSESSETSD